MALSPLPSSGLTTSRVFEKAKDADLTHDRFLGSALILCP